MTDPFELDTIPTPLRATALGRTPTDPAGAPAAVARVDCFGLSDRGKVRPGSSSALPAEWVSSLCRSRSRSGHT